MTGSKSLWKKKEKKKEEGQDGPVSFTWLPDKMDFQFFP